MVKIDINTSKEFDDGFKASTWQGHSPQAVAYQIPSWVKNRGDPGSELLLAMQVLQDEIMAGNLGATQAIEKFQTDFGLTRSTWISYLRDICKVDVQVLGKQGYINDDADSVDLYSLTIKTLDVIAGRIIEEGKRPVLEDFPDDIPEPDGDRSSTLVAAKFLATYIFSADDQGHVVFFPKGDLHLNFGRSNCLSSFRTVLPLAQQVSQLRKDLFQDWQTAQDPAQLDFFGRPLNICLVPEGVRHQLRLDAGRPMVLPDHLILDESTIQRLSAIMPTYSLPQGLYWRWEVLADNTGNVVVNSSPDPLFTSGRVFHDETIVVHLLVTDAYDVVAEQDVALTLRNTINEAPTGKIFSDDGKSRPPREIPAGQSVSLTMQTEDLNNDTVTVAWEIYDGSTLVYQSNNSKLKWHPPILSADKQYGIRAILSDGHPDGTVTLRHDLNVKARIPYIDGIVDIPGGEFMMGSIDGEPDERRGSSDTEKGTPVLVTMSGFRLSKSEVTVGQYKAYLSARGDTRYKGLPDLAENKKGDRYPVVGLTYDAMMAFCEYYGGKLPTAAQIEYASKGPNHTDVNGTPIHTAAIRANGFRDNSEVCGTNNERANGFGVCDLAGNVWEATGDRYDENSYDGMETKDPANPITTDRAGQLMEARGASWGHIVENSRAANRFKFALDNSNRYIGFRVVWPLPQGSSK